MTPLPSLGDCLAMDRDDPLADMRDRFILPDGLIYLDGNSLGPLAKGVAEDVSAGVVQEWGRGLISSWNAAGWINLAGNIGDKIGRLIGAGPGEVMVGDSTSVNIFKLASSLLSRHPSRRKIITERENFPTDIYALEGLIRLLGNRHELILVSADEVMDILSDDTALLLLTHVNYRTGRMFDMAGVTAAARRHDIPLIWDLCHSAGAVPVDLNGTGAEYAVGCGYKYLNGGPGAPAFVYVAAAAIDEFEPSLTGWFAHARQFAFEPSFEAAAGIDKLAIGTPPVLSLIALNAALDVWDNIDFAAVRTKSLKLTGLFIDLVSAWCPDLHLLTPADEAARGSQVSFTHDGGYAMIQALIEAAVVGDFRDPNILRFGFAPLYIRFADVFNAAEKLKQTIDTGRWKDPKFSIRNQVT